MVKVEIKALLLSLIFLQWTPVLYSQSWIWGQSDKGTTSSQGIAAAADSSGNIYVTGVFRGSSVKFGPWTLTGNGGINECLFLVKYDSAGNALWAKKNGGWLSTCVGYGVSTDSFGNVLVTGWFSGKSVMLGSITLYNADTTGTTEDIFIAKYSSNGNVVWAKRAGGANREKAYSISSDSNGSTLITGWYNSNPLLFDTVSFNYGGVFLAKFDSSGSFLWGKVAGDNFGRGNSVATDKNGNVFLTGNFNSTISFDSINLVNNNSDFFIAKFSPNGNTLWAKCATGSFGMNVYGRSVSADPSGNAIVTGWVYNSFSNDTLLFDSCIITNPNFIYTFITKYDGNGNVLWGKSAGAGGGYSSAIDPGGNVFITGFANGSVFSFDSVTVTVPPHCGTFCHPAFLIKLDNDGKLLCAAVTADGSQYCNGGCFYEHNGITADRFGNAFITGLFHEDTLIFGIDTLSHSTPTGENAFLAKYSCCLFNNSVYGKDTICKGDSIQLTVTGAAYYSWNPQIGLTCINCPNPEVSPDSTITYTVTGSTGTCSNSSFVTIIVLPLPVVSVTEDTTICQGQSVTLIASGGNFYNWSTGSTSQVITVIPFTSSVFEVTVTNDYGCLMDTSILINVNPLPASSIYGLSEISCGDSVVLSGTGGKYYLWNTGDTISSILINPGLTTVYALTVTDSNNCSSDTVFAVVVKPMPAISIPKDTTVFSGDTISLSASGGTNYLWNTGETSSSIIIHPLSSEIYCVTVTDTTISNCSNTACVNIIVEPRPCGNIFIPSMFSPNNDGQNDVLFVRGKCIKEMTLAVYNRWGQKVFETNDIARGWDGTFKGKPLATGVFVYSLLVTQDSGETIARKGNITLVR